MSQHKGHFTIKITEYPVPCTFAKPPKLETYDITTYPKEHVEYLDSILDYHQVRGALM